MRGIPIQASGSWLLVVLVLIWFTSGQLLAVTGVSQTTSVLLAAATILLFFASVVAHELGHAVAAQRAGLRVERIELWMFGGFARLSEAPRTPTEQLRIALAGPAVTLLITVVLLGGLQIVEPGAFGTYGVDDQPPPIVAVLGLVGVLNAVVLVLNLIPAYPLDGGVAARAIAWRITGDPHKATRVAAGAGVAIGLLVLIAGIGLFATGVGRSEGLSLMLLGWLVSISARSSMEMSRRQSRLELVTVGAVADPSVPTVEGHHTVLEATDAGGPPGRWFVVHREGHPPALLSAEAVDTALAKGQPALTLAELVEEADDRTIQGDTPLREVVADPRLRDGGPLLALSAAGDALGLVTGSTLRSAVATAARGR